MNKQMIVMIALVACMFAMPASAETVEVRGEVVNLAGAQAADLVWNAYNFGAFWYDLDDDLMTETLTIAANTLSPMDRTIDANCLIYQTTPVYQEYEVHGCEGLTIEGDAGYYVEGWIGELYVAINGRADKLCEPLVEFGGDDMKTLAAGEDWELGGGFTLTAKQIIDGDTAELSLSKDGSELDSKTVSSGEVYTYTADMAGESDVPVFSCYVDAVFKGFYRNIVQIKYAFLIDDDVLDIDIGNQYGVMEVTTASSSQVTLGNYNPVDLDLDSTKEIMENMYFEVADDDCIRFYPFVECDETETCEIRGTVLNLVGTQSADITWDAHNFSAFWYDLDGDRSTEMLTIAANTLDAPWDRHIDKNCLSYTTCPFYREYKLYANKGLTVNGDTGYYIESWMGEKYVAVNGRADKLSELLCEFGYDDSKTFAAYDSWDMSGGFALEAQVDLEGNKVWFGLSKDGSEIDSDVVSAGEVYAYTADICGEDDVPVFSCYVDAIFGGNNTTQIKYVFLIDDDVLEIECGDEYGAMVVMTASSLQVILTNDETAINLGADSEEHIMGNLYFKVADDNDAIRFYPFIGDAPPAEGCTITDADGDGVPDVWDADDSTPAGYWTDSDGQGRKWGDMNGDDKLTSVDALMILQAAVGKINL